MARVHKTSAVPLRPVAGNAPVEHLDVPPTFEKPKSVHPRRLLPLVAKGEPRAFPEPEVTEGERRRVPDPALDVVIEVNTPLTAAATQDTSATPGEPSVAVNGDTVFYTGNWYAAVSSDRGRTFRFISPANAFRALNPPGSSFCCDQIALYLPAIDTFVWLLQYGPSTGDNLQRLAFAKTADVAAGRWRLFDVTTGIIGAKGAFLDFPDLAAGSNCLYMTTNVFAPDKIGAAVVRIPFDGIESGNVVAKVFLSYDYNSFRVAQNCGDTAYFAAHHDSSTLAVFRWPESEDAPARRRVGVASWRGPHGYTSKLPDGRTWLDRCDPRITGATLAGRDAWFAWTVDKGSARRKQPFVQIARVNTKSMRLVENNRIADTKLATAYAALATNVDGEVGAVYVTGGATCFPTHMCGILSGERRSAEVAASSRGPLDPVMKNGEWGDYFAVRPAYPNGKLFAASGYAMEGAGNGKNRDATPRFVIFGRSVNVTK